LLVVGADTLGRVRRTVDAVKEALLACDDEAVWPTAPLQQLRECGPAAAGLDDLVESSSSLLDGKRACNARKSARCVAQLGAIDSLST
jgi:hypothetical protein